MKPLKKLLIIALALVFGVMSFVACSRGSGKDDGKDDGTTNESGGYSTAEECANSVVQHKINGDYQMLHKSFPGDFTKRHMKSNGYDRADLDSAMKEAAAAWNEYAASHGCMHEKTEILSAEAVEEYEINWINDYYGINAEEARLLMVAVTYSWDGESRTDNYSGCAVKIGGRWYLSPGSFNELFFDDVDDHLGHSGNNDAGSTGEDG